MSRTLPTILSMADLTAFLPVSDSAELARLELVWKGVEASVRRFCGQNLAQAADPYVDFLPETDHYVPVDPLLNYDLRYSGGAGNRYSGPYTGPAADGHLLYLSQGLVRSVSSIYLDTESSAGTDVDDFPSTTLMSTDEYFLDVAEKDPSNLLVSYSGCVVKKSGAWPTRRRTVKITYIAGFTEAELDAEFSDLRLATIEEVINRYQGFAASEGSPVKAERLGDWEITYQPPTGPVTGLSERFRDLLQPYVRYRLP